MGKEGSDTASPGADVEGWRRVIAENRLPALRMEDIVAAVQDFSPHGETRVVNALISHISDALMGWFRKHVGSNHPNSGEDIILRAHANVISAILKPTSADGKGLRTAFWARAKFRLVDAIQEELKQAAREPSSEKDDDDEDSPPRPEAITSHCEIEESIYVGELLALIPDTRKCLAFRLHMEDVPLKSTKGYSIAEAVGVSAKTAGKWIEEVKELLKSEIGGRA